MEKEHRNLLYLIIALLVLLNVSQYRQQQLTDKVAIQLINELDASEEQIMKLNRANTPSSRR